MEVKLFFITGNKHKAEEVQAIWPAVQQLDIDLPEIQSLDPKEIVAAKLTEARKHHQGIIAVEDVSLVLAGMNGLPGPMIKYFLQALGTEGMYELAKKIGNDRATVTCSVGVSVPNQDLNFFSCTRAGQIVSPRALPTTDATSIFAWNPIFQPDGHHKTYAEMTLTERTAISHRGGAWREVKQYLESHA